MSDTNTINEFTGILSNLMAILGFGAGGSVLCLAGAVPRAGPLRAVMFALGSRFATATDQSVRTDSVRALLNALTHCKRGQYIVVTGSKGVGKTCIIETALQRTCGVITTVVVPGASQNDIVDKVLKGITRVNLSFWDPAANARRVLFFYGFLPLQPPIVVLRAAERTEGKPHADITGAVRQLTTFGLRVVVDASTNSLPVDTTETKREIVHNIEPMSRETLLSIPENKQLFETLEKLGLSSLIWAVFGGIPADHDRLRERIAEAGMEIDDVKVKLVVQEFVQEVLCKAIDRYDMMLAKHPEFLPILDMFTKQPEVPRSVLREKKLVQPSPDKVLRAVKKGNEMVLVPTDPAMRMVLCRGLKKVPSVEELLAMTVE